MRDGAQIPPRGRRSGVLGDVDGDVGGFDGGGGDHSGLEAEFVGGFAAEQGDEPVRPGPVLILLAAAVGCVGGIYGIGGGSILAPS